MTLEAQVRSLVCCRALRQLGPATVMGTVYQAWITAEGKAFRGLAAREGGRPKKRAL